MKQDNDIYSVIELDRPDWLQLSVCAAFIWVYLFIGTVVFVSLEDPVEEAVRAEFRSARAKLLAKHSCLDDKELEDFIHELVLASKFGVYATNNVTNPRAWSMSGSIFFCTSVMTSVGYGDKVPLTRSTMLVCILFTVIGIPLLSSLNDHVVHRILDYLERTYALIEKRISKTIPVKELRISYDCVVACLVLTLLVVMPAIIFNYIETEWDFLDALYYCVISVTRIGLGDFVPGEAPYQKHRDVYKILAAVNLLISPTLLLVLITLIINAPLTNNEYSTEEKTPLRDSRKVDVENKLGVQ